MTDLEAAALELYALAPEEFVAARAQLVKQAKQAKDKALAGAIGALRKPTRTAWLVNTLARDDPGAVGTLLDLGDALRTAQQQRDGTALRELSARRRKDIDALVRRATELGRGAGHPPSESTLNEVAQTLQAALGDAAVAEQVRGARLAGAAVYGGFGGPAEPSTATAAAGDDLAALLAASMPAAQGSETQGSETQGSETQSSETQGSGAGAASREDEATARERRAVEDRRAALAQALAEARTALDEAQEAADRATEEADAAAEELDRLRAELEQAEATEREARTRARTAREELRSRRGAVDEAEAALRAGAS